MNRGRLAVLIAVMSLLQITVFAQIRPFGVSADLFLMASIISGLAFGPLQAIRHGFGFGLVLDLLSGGPVGLGAGVYALVGWGASTTSANLHGDDRAVARTSTFLGSFLGTVLYGLSLIVLGQSRYASLGLLATALLVAVFGVVLVRPLMWLHRWAREDESAFARPARSASVVN